MNKLIKTAAAAGCALAACGVQAAVGDTSYYFLDLYAVQHQERVPERDLGFGGRIGIGSPISPGGATSVEFGLFGNPIETKAGSIGDQYGLMLDLVRNFRLGGLSPYVFAGAGALRESSDFVADGYYWAIEAGLGLAINVFGDSQVRIGVSAMDVYNDTIRPDQDQLVDMRYGLGLAVPFGSAPAAAPAPVARAVDSDGDGLADSQDACPTIPASTADGCPPPAPVVQADSDNDGVADPQDDCPGTLAGLKVDARGCAIQTETQSVVLKGVTFLPASATLTKQAMTVLDAAVAALEGQKDLKVELGGHTDSQGKDEANLALSQKRADSVRKYLVSKGIAADRLTAKGYGETQPIADNNTAEGRAENRRVELKVVK